MIEQHPNLSLLSKLDIFDLDSSAKLFSEDFVWHYFNPKLPDIQGDYVGVEGLKDFFETISGISKGTFKLEPVSATPVGEELVVVQARNTLEFDGKTNTVDVVVVWRIVDGQFAEAWDIPSAFTQAG